MSQRTRRPLFPLLAGTTALLIAPMLGPAYGAPARAPVQITFWSWVPGIQAAINLFNNSHPGIHVTLTASQCCTQEYTRLNAALSARKSAPDVAQIEFDMLPQYLYIYKGALVDLSKYGANTVKNQFTSYIWKQVSLGNSVYAIPQNAGPMVMFYRKDIFSRYNCGAPTLWSDFISEATFMHEARANLYLTNLPTGPDSTGWWTGLFQQNEGALFSGGGNAWNVQIRARQNRYVMYNWDLMNSTNVLKLEDNFTQAEYKDWQQGNLAVWIAGIWGAHTLMTHAASTSGKWAMAPIPQWPGTHYTTGAWGGSTDAVLSQSKHPAEAATFVEWLNTNAASLNLLIKNAQIWPASNVGLKSPALSAPLPFFGGQSLSDIGAESAAGLYSDLQFGPPMYYFRTDFSNVVSASVHSHQDLGEALDTVQNQVVAYMQQKGFSLN